MDINLFFEYKSINKIFMNQLITQSMENLVEKLWKIPLVMGN